MSFHGFSFPKTTLNNTLILGGSFNPIHHGHLICARTSAEILGFETVLLIPAGQPPMKQQSDMASGAHRLAMCECVQIDARQPPSVEAQPTPTSPPSNAKNVTFAVSDLEILADSPSYTLTTARKLREMGMTKIHWLIGADQLNALPRWHQPEALVEEVNFVVMARPGYELNWPALPHYMRRLEKNRVEAPHLDISATNIRSRVAAGLPIDWLTPPAVVEYIREHHLYRARPNP